MCKLAARAERRSRENEVAFSPDGARLATAAADHKVRLWNFRTGRRVGRPFDGDAMAFSPNGSTIAAAAGDTVRLWDVKTRHQLGPPLEGGGLDFAFSADGETVATVGNDEVVRLWDVALGRLLGPLLQTSCVRVAFASRGSTLACTGHRGIVGPRKRTNAEALRSSPPHSRALTAFSCRISGPCAALARIRSTTFAATSS
jgi:WD40 repeat protein